MRNDEKILFINSLGQSVELSNFSHYFIENITGLDSVNNTITTTKSPGQDGSTVSNETIEQRDITISGAINERRDDIISLRKKELIKIFNPKLAGKLVHIGKDGEKSIDCKIEVSPSFPQKEKIYQRFSIQLSAPFPYLSDRNETNFELNQVEPLFEFDLELTEDGIEMGSMNNSGVAYYNDGDAPTPVEITIFGPVQTPKVINVATGEFIAVKQPLLGNEKMIINTEFGNKSVVIVNDRGDERNAFNYIDLNSTFFELQPGDNWIKFEAEVGADTATINIKFRKLYTGV